MEKKKKQVLNALVKFKAIIYIPLASQMAPKALSVMNLSPADGPPQAVEEGKCPPESDL